jgi:hypothetical protein
MVRDDWAKVIKDFPKNSTECRTSVGYGSKYQKPKIDLQQILKMRWK